MPTAWEILCAAGVPDGAVRPPPSGPLPAAEVTGALAALVDAGFVGLSPVQRVCLLAWLRAFRHNWPRRFDAILGGVGAAAIAALPDAEADPNRYLKLRRIAIENLAGSL